MSVESEILRIQHNIADSYAKVAEKGGSVPLQPNSRNLAVAIDSIPQTLPAPDNNPIGTVISFLGTAAPSGYLICDGTEYSVSEYPALADFFRQQFGSANHFGGDGETAFAVPDLRNLFLRGYHGEAEEQLSGEVGEKQEATKHPYVWIDDNIGGAAAGLPKDIDSGFGLTRSFGYGSGLSALKSDINQSYSSRPANMAVLYCIKAVALSAESSEEIYSTEERRIGTWIDGKPVYQKTIIFENASIPPNWVNLNPTIVEFSASDIRTLIECTCRFEPNNLEGFRCCTIGSLFSGYLRFFNIYSNDAFTCSGTFTLKYTKTTD